MTALPSSISNLMMLLCLKVESNELTDFPDVSKMIGLRQLFLANNKLTAFPEGCNNIELSYIDLSSNRIEEIPTELPASSLKHLDVSYNEIVEVPTELSGCTSLTYLDCSNNKVKDRFIKKIIESGNTKPTVLLHRLECDTNQSSGKGTLT